MFVPEFYLEYPPHKFVGMNIQPLELEDSSANCGAANPLFSAVIFLINIGVEGGPVYDMYMPLMFSEYGVVIIFHANIYRNNMNTFRVW